MSNPGLWGALACAVVLRAAPTAAQVVAMPATRTVADPSRFLPRVTLMELQYPQGVAASGGAWLRLSTDDRLRPAFLAEAEVGLAGAALDLGLGGLGSGTDVDNAQSFGAEGVLLRTWPWWSPWLPTSTTYGGVQLFVHRFAYRCSVGMLWSLDRDARPARTFIGGCGVGTP
ncbi:MAG TPA: hypothetical protein VKZ18_22605 [Polyangia bacterium]|nr:hypothetical protein [Polyangia bacterium]